MSPYPSIRGHSGVCGGRVWYEVQPAVWYAQCTGTGPPFLGRAGEEDGLPAFVIGCSSLRLFTFALWPQAQSVHIHRAEASALGLHLRCSSLP